MSIYKETFTIKGTGEYLYAEWNTNTNTCLIMNQDGRVLVSGTDDEIVAVREYLNKIEREYDSNIGSKFQ